jgi:beta-glucosidase
MPNDFIWGGATAAYQVEGAVNEEGRGLSIWDTFSHQPGNVLNDDNADITVDQYHRIEEDIQWMKWIGLRGYRFSLAWTRILPEGTGKVNEKGIEYYERLIDLLLKNEIMPLPTLFHWDLPQVLEDKYGGWRSAETAKSFGEYAGIAAKRLSDRLTHLITINEFVSFTDNGYYTGEDAPGKKISEKGRNQVRHNALLAHGLGVQAIRANAVKELKVGLAENCSISVPVMETPEHIHAAREAFRQSNAPFLTAVMEGRYTPEYLEQEGSNAPEFTEDEMKIIGEHLDFLGVNAYFPNYVRAKDNKQGYEIISVPRSYPYMEMRWLLICPQIAYWGPRLVNEIWNMNEIFITENGASCKDRLTRDNEVLDTDRLMFLRNYFINAQRAVAEGFPLKGYFVWSLLDNFEWHNGFSQRLGLLYVNYQNLERIAKLSAYYYKEVIKNNSVL